jgi:hypothetical protein
MLIARTQESTWHTAGIQQVNEWRSLVSLPSEFAQWSNENESLIGEASRERRDEESRNSQQRQLSKQIPKIQSREILDSTWRKLCILGKFPFWKHEKCYHIYAGGDNSLDMRKLTMQSRVAIIAEVMALSKQMVHGIQGKSGDLDLSYRSMQEDEV